MSRSNTCPSWLDCRLLLKQWAICLGSYFGEKCEHPPNLGFQTSCRKGLETHWREFTLVLESSLGGLWSPRQCLPRRGEMTLGKVGVSPTTPSTNRVFPLMFPPHQVNPRPGAWGPNASLPRHVKLENQRARPKSPPTKRRKDKTQTDSDFANMVDNDCPPPGYSQPRLRSHGWEALRRSQP